MKKLLAFLNNMDSRAWRTVWVSLALLAGVGLMIGLGKSGVISMSVHAEEWLETLRTGPWALPAVIAIFCLSSFVAAPQFVLIGACVVAFGPWAGFMYSMAGTIVAGALHFYLGRLGGSQLVERYGGSTVNRMSRFIGRNDFLASLIVRNVPTAPAIVVNMAFGASRSVFWRFIAGLTIGSIPKTAIVALLGQSVGSALSGGMIAAIALAAAVVGIWLMVALAARKAVRADEEPAAVGHQAAPGAGGPAPEIETIASSPQARRS